MNGTDPAPQRNGQSRRRMALVVFVQPGDVDEILRALSRRRRRYVMYYLQDHETGTLEELARYVAATEADVPLEEAPDDRRKALEAALRHSDLPQLADAGFVEYDPRSGDVRYDRPPRLFDRMLEAVGELERSDAVRS